MKVWVQIVLLLVGLVTKTLSMQMELRFGERKCFNEDVPIDRRILVEFHCAAGSKPMELDLFVTNMNGKVLIHKSGLSHLRTTIEAPKVPHKSLYGSYHKAIFTTYRFCLMHQTVPSQVAAETGRKVEFRIRAAAVESDSSGALQAGQASDTQGALHELEGEVIELLKNMDSLNEEERLLAMTNEAMSRFVVTLGSLSSLVVLAVGTLQLEIIQIIFKNRRLIH